MKNKFNVPRLAMTVLIFAVSSALFGAARPAAVQAIPPTIRIVVPERFRVLTDQFFDLRIEAETLGSSRVRPQITVFDENGRQESINYAGQYEVTSDNDNNPNNIDRSFTYRKISFGQAGAFVRNVTVSD